MCRGGRVLYRQYRDAPLAIANPVNQSGFFQPRVDTRYQIEDGATLGRCGEKVARLIEEAP
jgi:hypothetical protein